MPTTKIGPIESALIATSNPTILKVLAAPRTPELWRALTKMDLLIGDGETISLNQQRELCNSFSELISAINEIAIYKLDLDDACELAEAISNCMYAVCVACGHSPLVSWYMLANMMVFVRQMHAKAVLPERTLPVNAPWPPTIDLADDRGSEATRYKRMFAHVIEASFRRIMSKILGMKSWLDVPKNWSIPHCLAILRMGYRSGLLSDGSRANCITDLSFKDYSKYGHIAVQTLLIAMAAKSEDPHVGLHSHHDKFVSLFEMAAKNQMPVKAAIDGMGISDDGCSRWG